MHEINNDILTVNEKTTDISKNIHKNIQNKKSGKPKE